MPVSVSYPGVYLEELPSSARTIVAAPTSVAVFVGYSHPYKTKNPDGSDAFAIPRQLFSFADYERFFGGLFTGDAFDNTLPHAVNQFFLNGGTECWVIGLRPQGAPLGQAPPALTMAAGAGNAGIVFTTKEPTGPTDLQVTIANATTAPVSADIVITYGRRTEAYRKVNLSVGDPDFIEKRLKDSALVSVAADTGGYPANFGTAATGTFPHNPLPANIFVAADYLPVFANDSLLDKISVFNLLVLPGVNDSAVLPVALAFAERKQAFFLMDPPQNYSADGLGGLPLIADYKNGNGVPAPPKSTNGALYFPYLRTIDPLTNQEFALAPSGYVAGVMARTDANRGVWKAPAGLQATVNNTLGVEEAGRMTDMRQGTLNQIGVNVIRTFPGSGTVVFGARTLVGADLDTAFQEHKYVPVRRLTLFIEQTLLRNLRWVIFEPNDEPLWNAIRVSIDGFMLSLFRQGAFQGRTPRDAFNVVCDSTTTTQTDINNGIVNIVVMFAPVKPAEFVVIKIAQMAGQSPQ